MSDATDDTDPAAPHKSTGAGTASDGTGAPGGEEAGQLTPRQRAVLAFIEAQIAQLGYPPTIREIGRHLGMRSTNGVNDHLKALERKGYIHREGNKSRTLRVVRASEDRPRHDGAVVASGRGKPAFRAGFGDLEIAFDEAFAGGDVVAINGPLPNNVYPLAAARGDRDPDLIEVPLLGRVAAGAPILADEDAEDTVKVSSFFLGRGARNQRIFALTVVGESMIEDGIFDGDFLFVKKQPVARPGEIVVVMIEGEATVKRFFPEGDRIRLQPANSQMDPIFVHRHEFKQTDILGVVVGVYRKF